MKASKRQLQSISRLSSQAVFDCLRKTRDLRWVAPSLIVQATTMQAGTQPSAAEGGDAPYGLCISASKKTAKRAVDRNRMRRRLKAVAQETLPRLAKPGLNYMITCRQPALTAPVADLEKDLRWCLKKMNLLKDA